MNRYLSTHRRNGKLELQKLFEEALLSPQGDGQIMSFLIKTLPTCTTRAAASKYSLDTFGPKSIAACLVKTVCSGPEHFLPQECVPHLQELLQGWAGLKKNSITFDLGLWSEDHTDVEYAGYVKFLDLAGLYCRSSKPMMTSIFLAGISMKNEIIASNAARFSNTLPDDVGDRLFRTTTGTTQFLVFQRLNKDSRNRISVAIEKEDETMYCMVCDFARILTPKQMRWVQGVLNIDGWSMRQFNTAMAGGNLELVTEMIEDKFPKFISDSRILMDSLFALGANPCNEDWTPVCKYILSVVNDRRGPVKFRAMGATELMCTEFFSTKRGIISELTNWSDLRVDPHRPYALLCDGTLCKLLRKNGILQLWSEKPHKPKFRIFPWMPVDNEALAILGEFNMI